MKAAVLYETNQPWVIEELTLDAPKAGEVHVKIGAAGAHGRGMGRGLRGALPRLRRGALRHRNRNPGRWRPDRKLRLKPRYSRGRRRPG